MGLFLSLHGGRAKNVRGEEDSVYGARKRLRVSSNEENDCPRLIPSLPDEISLQILARLPRIWYLNAKCVSRSWKAAVSSDELYNLRKELQTTEEWLYILKKGEDERLLWRAFDPVSGRWQRLPPMPDVVHEEKSESGTPIFGIWTLIGSTIRFADSIKSWIQRKDTTDRSSLCGCTVNSVNGCVYVLGGFSRSMAVRCVWKYDPRHNAWCEVSSMSSGRAYCKTAQLNGKLYAVGGVSKGRGGLAPLRSAEVYDPCTGLWSQIPGMTFSKAQVLPAALFADIVKPIATGITSYRGQLYVPQSLYTWPFFVDIGGEVYDPLKNCWDEMPAGMGDGWPARQAGTKLSVVVKGDLYALDPSSSSYCGKIKVYDPQMDAWKIAISGVPVRDFADTESPCLLAGIQGKLHVVTKDAGGNTVIFQADLSGNTCSSSCLSPAAVTTDESTDASITGEEEIWKIVATKKYGAEELVSCLVLDI